MAPRNSGVKITVWDDDQKNWLPLNKVYLEEARGTDGMTGSSKYSNLECSSFHYL